MFEAALVVSTLLVGLVGGLVFAYAVVAMPGLAVLTDREFLRSFKVMDRVIQDNQPLFMVAWVGSVIALVAAAALGFGQLTGLDRWLLVGAAAAYVLGVQVPTAAFNIPLNNRLQDFDLESAGEDEVTALRKAFEMPWNRWNTLRTVVSVLVMSLLLAVLLRV